MVAANMIGTGKGARGAPQTAPYSAVCAIQDGTRLHFITSSHFSMEDTTFCVADAIPRKIPVGWGCLFNAVSAHAGQACAIPTETHARIHMHLRDVRAVPSKLDEVQWLEAEEDYVRRVGIA